MMMMMMMIRRRPEKDGSDEDGPEEGRWVGTTSSGHFEYVCVCLPACFGGGAQIVLFSSVYCLSKSVEIQSSMKHVDDVA